MRCSAAIAVLLALVASGCAREPAWPTTVVPPAERVIDGGPFLTIRQVCYGECSDLQAVPDFVVYDDGRLVWSTYRGDEPYGRDAAFEQHSTQLDQDQMEELVSLATKAKLEDAGTTTAGTNEMDDGGGYVFLSELGSSTSFVHAPHLPYVEVEPKDLRQDLSNLVDEFQLLTSASDWEEPEVRWAVLANPISQASDLLTEWPGPSLAAAGQDGCLVLAQPDLDDVTEALLADVNTTFSASVDDEGRVSRITPRPLMPHESGCEDITTYRAWFWERYQETE